MDTHAKALAINLDPEPYGSFAEIGAGQEVARWFLTVGGASGTVAQTISAYDKTFSDDTYGPGTRYVSRERLVAMLDHEYRLLIDRLGVTRGGTSRFFAFADTASARNYRGDNEEHAWVGLRFQHQVGAPHSDVLLHVHLQDSSAAMQQDALGILGVNLIHAAIYHSSDIDALLRELWDDLSLQRLELDVIVANGPAFEGFNLREANLKLIHLGMSHAVVIDAEGRVQEPASVLRKRPLIVDRGLFIELAPYHAEMLQAAEQRLRAEGVELLHSPCAVLELTLRHASGGLTPPDAEVLERIRYMNTLGPVIVSDFAEVFQLAAYLRRFSQEPMRFVMGVSLLALLLQDRFYHELAGRLLEGLGRLLDQNVKLYAYPMPKAQVLAALGDHLDHYELGEGAGGLVSAEDLRPVGPEAHLFAYLRESGWVVPLPALQSNETENQDGASIK